MTRDDSIKIKRTDKIYKKYKSKGKE